MSKRNASTTIERRDQFIIPGVKPQRMVVSALKIIGDVVTLLIIN